MQNATATAASAKPTTEYRRQRGDRLGFNWMMPSVAGKRAIRHVVFDTNFWKSFVHARLAVPLGDRGCLSLWGRGDGAAENGRGGSRRTAPRAVLYEDPTPSQSRPPCLP